MLEIDCASLIGKHQEGYAHEYDNYLGLFRLLGHSQSPVKVSNPPRCWVPFIRYLGHEVVGDPTTPPGPDWECNWGNWDTLYEQMDDKRRAVEMASASRPELVHALYCADTEWPCSLRRVTAEKEFAVTCNGSFFRDEVKAYRKVLETFTPHKRRCVLVPCAASKPYPAPLHDAVLRRLYGIERWHVIVATGVLGLVPEELWGCMPHYDSGLPNWLRCRDTVAWYFRKHPYQAIVVYSDFYANAISEGLAGISGAVKCVKFLFGTHYRDTYENLLLPEHLMALEKEVSECDKTLNGNF